MDFRVFSSKIVHAELQRAGYQPPSLRTVARWTSSGRAPVWAEQAMRELLGIEKEADPPEWASRLIAEMTALREAVSDKDPPEKDELAAG